MSFLTLSGFSLHAGVPTGPSWDGALTLNVHFSGQELGPAVKSQLGMPTLHIGVPGLSPGSSTSNPASLEVADDASNGWVPITHVRDPDRILGSWLQSRASPGS